MSAPPASALTTPIPPTAVTVLAVLGDSTAVGLGDPVAAGGWRGAAVLLRDALGAPTLVNVAANGARAASVRRAQLPAAVAAGPDVAVLFVGINDTMRSDFDPVALRDDLAATVAGLQAVGAHVVLLRYHDHTRVFRLPAPLRRALRRRIEELNAVVDAVVAGAVPGRTGVLDLHLLDGVYERAAWSVDRLHPAETGHRILAAGVAALLAGAGFAVPRPVALACAGGRAVTSWERAAWLLVRGVPWLVRRGRDLGPVLVQGLLTELGRSRPEPG